jgi:hypothetical protein
MLAGTLLFEIVVDDKSELDNMEWCTATTIYSSTKTAAATAKGAAGEERSFHFQIYMIESKELIVLVRQPTISMEAGDILINSRQERFKCYCLTH